MKEAAKWALEAYLQASTNKGILGNPGVDHIRAQILDNAMAALAVDLDIGWKRDASGEWSFGRRQVPAPVSQTSNWNNITVNDPDCENDDLNRCGNCGRPGGRYGCGAC